MQRICITHEYERRLDSISEPCNELEDGAQARATFERPTTRALDRRAFGRRVREGNAKFDDVGTGLRHAEYERLGRIEIRISGGEKGDQRSLAFRLQLRETSFDAAHQ